MAFEHFLQTLFPLGLALSHFPKVEGNPQKVDTDGHASIT